MSRPGVKFPSIFDQRNRKSVSSKCFNFYLVKQSMIYLFIM